MFMYFLGPLRHQSRGELHCAKCCAKPQRERERTYSPARSGWAAEMNDAEWEGHLYLLSRKVTEKQKT